MDRIDLNAAFAARVAADRADKIANNQMPATWTEICPGTNIKVDDDLEMFGTPTEPGRKVRVLGPTLNDPTYFQTASVDPATMQFTTGQDPCGDLSTQYITDRAPADPEDTDPIYVEPEQP
jgi:hypothetical protein